MKNKKLIIYGIGKFAEYIKYAFTHDSPYEVKAFCIESSYLSQLKTQSEELEILNFDSLEKEYSPKDYHLFIAVGNDSVRERIFKDAKRKGYSIASYVSSKAIIWKELIIGENVFISEDTAMQPFVEIGDNTLIIGAKIGHHCTIGKNVLLSLTFIGAEASIGNNSFVGLNSVIKPGTKIGNQNIIGMGCNITRNTNDGEVYSAPSAIKRKVSYRDISKKYL